jgi:Tol biopolymer transport system component
MSGWIAYGYGIYYGSYGDRHNGGRGIWAMDPERRGIQKQLSTRSGEPVAWSSDGSKLLILRQTGQSSAADQALYVLNADGSESLLIDSGCAYCLSGGSFSPDGSKVVYASMTADGASSGIYVVDAAGGIPRLLPQPIRGPYDPVFSPDGSQIAYFAGGGDHDNTLWVMSAKGSSPRVLLRDVGMMVSSAGLRYLGWSPDGRRLAFEMGYGPYSIYVVGADGSGLTRPIAHGMHPEWSPDGSRIAYNFFTLNNPGPLMIADADGTHAQRFDVAGSGPWSPLDRAQS